MGVDERAVRPPPMRMRMTRNIEAVKGRIAAASERAGLPKARRVEKAA